MNSKICSNVLKVACLTVLFLTALPSGAKAVSLYDPSKRKQVASTIMPVLPPDQLISGIQGSVSRETANALRERCLSRVPNRFTADGLQYYCTCSSAATMGNITFKELRDLQDKRNWVAGNKSFEKYIDTVVTPCMDMPIEDIEYESCVLRRNNDWRVKNVPQYCQCVSGAVRAHVKEFGTAEIITEWGKPGKVYDTPLDALWNSNPYNQYKDKFRTDCLEGAIPKSPYDTNRSPYNTNR